MLPDAPLLVIFDCYLRGSGELEAWRTLVHVCRKWRNLVFGSSNRLNLRLVCTPRRRVREMLDIWPPLPIVMSPYGLSKLSTRAADNIIAALEHNDRIQHVELWEVSSSLLNKAFQVMQGPFPVLTDLDIRCDEDEIAPVVPDSFLGVFAPRLRKLSLDNIPFPGLPKLLFSASDLVEISLWHIPHSGYISPSAMVDCLSSLDRLESLWLLFKSSQSRPDRETRPPPPQTRCVFPSLAHFEFKGASDYLEDFVARINAPLLDHLDIGFFHQLLFDTPQLAQFISRTPSLRHTMKHAWPFPMLALRSHFDRQLTKDSGWKYPATNKIGSSHPWRKSVALPSLGLSLPRWNTFTSAKLDIYDRLGKTTSRTPNGSNFYVHSLL